MGGVPGRGEGYFPPPPLYVNSQLEYQRVKQPSEAT